MFFVAIGFDSRLQELVCIIIKQKKRRWMTRNNAFGLFLYQKSLTRRNALSGLSGMYPRGFATLSLFSNAAKQSAAGLKNSSFYRESEAVFQLSDLLFS
ncbi:MAG: hypothetical protein KGZ57_05280 [Dethiobacter sp.]|nr:hypothetical protein [Dethiobacter sp.]